MNLSSLIINNADRSRDRKPLGFSLVEVVVAVGIFALAIVGVIGLLVPTSQNITNVADSDSASRVISAIQSGLQEVGFDAVQSKLIDPGTTSVPDTKIFYAAKDGSKIGDKDRKNPDNSPYWSGDQEKFFEFTLVRNNDLSPSDDDDTAGFLAFTVVLRWPAYAPNADGTGTKVDASQQSVMVVPAAITR